MSLAVPVLLAALAAAPSGASSRADERRWDEINAARARSGLLPRKAPAAPAAPPRERGTGQAEGVPRQGLASARPAKGAARAATGKQGTTKEEGVPGPGLASSRPSAGAGRAEAKRVAVPAPSRAASRTATVRPAQAQAKREAPPAGSGASSAKEGSPREELALREAAPRETGPRIWTVPPPSPPLSPPPLPPSPQPPALTDLAALVHGAAREIGRRSATHHAPQVSVDGPELALGVSGAAVELALSARSGSSTFLLAGAALARPGDPASPRQ
jgi:hypothetical protein